VAADLFPDPLGMRIDFCRLDPDPDPGEQNGPKIIEEVLNCRRFSFDG
jgi:hypothetical protein